MSFEVFGSGANKRHLPPQKQGPKLYRRQISDENCNKQVRHDLSWKEGLWTLNHFLLNESNECKKIYVFRCHIVWRLLKIIAGNFRRTAGS